VFENVTEPRTIVFTHAPQESARHLVGTAMFGKPGQRRRQRIDELWAEAARGPRFERAEIEIEAYDGKSCIQGRSYIHRTIENAHGDAP
jgi:hypothetical protein